MWTSLATLDIAIILVGLPVIGNLFDMPTEKEWLTFAKWGEKYSNIASIPILGWCLVILNSTQTAISILDKKSSIYSDRPVVGMGGELVGWKNLLPLMPYRVHFRNYCRLAHQLFGTNITMNQFLPMLELEAHSPGGFLANYIPILTHVPDWFPGAGFKQTTQEYTSTLSNFVEKPYNYVKQEMVAGTARHSLTSSQLEGEVTVKEEYNVKWLASALYAGQHINHSFQLSTIASIYAFFKVMLLYPDIQAKAQAEIDTVIGSDRLPRFDDREHLLYVNALALEVIQWHTVAPTALPHCSTEDDVQSGYFIPKGSLVYPNIWKMLHDPAVYEQPFEFKLERFIQTEAKEPELDPYKLTFGFGQQVLADASIFISCAMTLSVFNILKYSENGITFEPDTGHTAGIARQEISLAMSWIDNSHGALDFV
ncbi:cytochrome P450 [Armillaria gallica]|uniref:Cytochrome P450 n=1 Tax=Armillaria gallica TaxID=47427 RepID=A0A2H3DZ87_ARMGA|nr:cytochrome P450 [Armillaria gallica]